MIDTDEYEELDCGCCPKIGCGIDCGVENND